MTDSPVASRSGLAEEILAGLEAGYHYSTLAYDDEGSPVEVAWNYQKEPGQPWPNDDFTDRELSERRRELAIEHQRHYEEVVADD